MSKNNKQNLNQDQNKDLLSKLDSICKKNEKIIYYISFILTLIFSLLLFDPKVSAGGDDSAYIIRAFQFLNNFRFPTYQGPLYPIVLSPFILLIGIKIKIIKGISLLFILGHLYFFNKTFKNRVPPSVHAFTLFIISVSSSYLYFAYQTYVEAFFLFIQSIGIWFFAKYFIDDNEDSFNIKTDYKKYIYLALIILSMGLTRSVGYAAIGSIVFYFIIYKKWKSIVPAIGSFGIIYVIYSLLRNVIWGISGADFSGQGKGLMYKNFYNHAEGKEDLAGFFQRLIDNSNLYLSKHLYVFWGLRKETVPMQTIPWLTVFTYVLIIVAIILFIRKNRTLFFVSTYAGMLCLITFIILQKSWDQFRLIIPYFPVITLTVFGGLYYLTKKQKVKTLQIIIPAIFIIIFISSFKVTSLKSKVNSKLKGPYYGQTPDWVNYIKCSKWCAKGLPKDAVVGSRKPSISFIYSGGKEFAGLYTFPSLNTAEVITNLEDSAYIVAPFEQIFGNNININLQYFLRQRISFIVNDNGNLIGVFKPEKEQIPELQTIIEDLGIEVSLSPGKYYLEKNMSSRNGYTVSPDSLLNIFIKKKIDYVIMANLRVNPHQKTGRTINTVQRYLAFIQQKYPGIFEQVIQFGENNNEPAVLFKINYDKFGLKKE